MEPMNEIVAQNAHQWSKRPFGCHGGDGIEAVVLAPVIPHEVVGQLHFRAQTKVYTIHSFDRVEIEPKLRLRLDNPFSIHIGVIPHITVAAEGA